MTDYKEIILACGTAVKVDAEDYERLSRYKWYLNVGGKGGVGYAARSKREGKKIVTVRMHRVIMNTPEGMEVDHKDEDSLDNRKHKMRNISKPDHIAHHSRIAG